MKELAASLISITDRAEPQMQNMRAPDISTPLRDGGWSRKEVLGHLIDSASNNHQRFVRAVLQDSLEFPAYDQNGCIRVQAPAKADWTCCSAAFESKSWSHSKRKPGSRSTPSRGSVAQGWLSTTQGHS